MKIKLILIGMVACLGLPLGVANAGAVVDPGLRQAGAGTDIERRLAHTAENFGRDDHCDDGDHDDKGNKGTNEDDGHHCHHHCDDGDHDDKGDKDHKDHDCDKSRDKPH